jgi:hypothetical protein
MATGRPAKPKRITTKAQRHKATEANEMRKNMKKNKSGSDANYKGTAPHYHLRFQIIPGANVKKDAKEILENSGISVSLNPWMTSLHCDRGRKFPADRKFQPIVSPTGKVSKACASFADTEWRKYVFNLYGRFAKLGFRVLWAEGHISSWRNSLEKGNASSQY